MRLDIQGLRALAVVLTIAFHARTPFHGAFVGLDVFFVISGFVITQMLIREHGRSNRIDFKRFYIRRFRRLTPALSVLVTVVLMFSIFLQSPFGAQQTTAATGAASLFFAANFVIAKTTGNYFDAPAEQNPLLNLWSLAAEEQFYLIFPAIFALSWLIARKRTSLKYTPLIMIAILTMVSFALAVMTSHQSLTWPVTGFFGYYGAVGRAWEFGAGAMLGMLLMNKQAFPRILNEISCWIGLGLILFGAITFNASTPYPGIPTLAPVLGTALLIAAGTGSANQSVISRGLACRPSVAIGDISYSWYLWHWPFIVFALMLWPRHPLLAAWSAAAISIVPAWLSYRYVEEPIRRVKNFSKRSTLNLAALAYGVPLAFSGLLAIGAAKVWWIRWPQEYSYAQSESYKCHDSNINLENCTFSHGLRGTAMLLGDSQALSLSDGFIEASEQLNLTSIVSSHSECPFILPNRMQWLYDNLGCFEWQKDALKAVLTVKPDVVVIANRPYFNGLTENVALLDEHGNVTTGSGSQQAWRESINGVIKPLRAAGIGVVLVEPIPEADYDIALGGLVGRPDQRTTTENARTKAQASHAMDTSVVNQNPGTVLLDPISALCDATTCPEIGHDQHLYADSRHLSPPGALLLEPDLELAMTRAMRQAGVN